MWQLAAIWRLRQNHTCEYEYPKRIRYLSRTAFLIFSTLSICSAYSIVVTQNPPAYNHSTVQRRELLHIPDGEKEVLDNKSLVQPTHQRRWLASGLEPNVIARTELNCTSDDFLPSSKYRGMECHVSNLWPKDKCPIADLIVPSCSRCTMWRRGQLPPAVSTEPPKYPSSTRPQVCDGTIWAFGHWNGEEWLPSESYPQCSNLTLSPADVYQCLKGRRVILLGDSMIRPLLGRFAAFLRGIPQYLDHVYHFPGAYYMANGTHDSFVEAAFLPSLHASAKKKDPKYKLPRSLPQEASWDPRVTLEMQFYWAPQFTNYTKYGRNFPSMLEMFGVLDGWDVLIAGPMYHEHGDYESIRTQLLQYFQELKRANKRVSYFFWIASIPNTAESMHEFIERNRLMRAFVEMLNEQSLDGNMSVPQRSYYVDAPQMVRNAPTKRIDMYHYQCTKHHQFPEWLHADETELPKNMDCRALLHLNLLLSILKVACNFPR
ncbi:hypothetical protein Vretimale_15777 [Volvox reticuliferus]|uniref:SGNH domain-containing protein n=1 Tax=Volvox reticuliferus TaxID=1737510 RepID=A0A8J4FXI3_9CHLO|nr:hypothetical protein Vretifemale_18469 [Volvox reticuliferus]GIM12433.1 hypothetical protein Vretimale_15777 [Volvox reticuliferus]